MEVKMPCNSPVDGAEAPVDLSVNDWSHAEAAFRKAMFYIVTSDKDASAFLISAFVLNRDEFVCAFNNCESKNALIVASTAGGVSLSDLKFSHLQFSCCCSKQF